MVIILIPWVIIKFLLQLINPTSKAFEPQLTVAPKPIQQLDSLPRKESGAVLSYGKHKPVQKRVGSHRYIGVLNRSGITLEEYDQRPYEEPF